ncbi:MAG: polysaccharide biosynthesis tyrosine autokinase [Planctomycetota bacterium]
MIPTEERSPAPPADAGRTDRLDLHGLLQVALGRKWLIATVTAIAVIATAVFSFTATPYYRATARLLIERSNANPVSFQEIYQLGTGSDDYYQTQHKILESRVVAEAAFAALPESDRAWFAAQLPDDPVAAFSRLIAIQAVPKSRLVDVLADHPQPDAARRMADALVDAYVANGLERQSDASSAALQKLQQDAEDLQQKLVNAEKAVQEFKSKNEIVSMNDRQSLAAARLEKLNDELAEIERDANEARSRLDAAERVAAGRISDAQAVDADLPESLVSPVIADCKRALLAARAERSQLAQTYKEKHPNLIAADSKIQSLELQLRRELDAVRDGLRNQVARAELRRADVKRRLDEQTKALLELETKAIQFQILKDEADATRRLHETVLNRLKEVQLIHGAETTNVHRLGSARVSTRPVRPNKTLQIVVALFAGLALGLLLAFTLDACDRTLKGSDDVSACLSLPILGQVPRMDQKSSCLGLDPPTLDERSALSEAFRTIRTGLAFTESGRDMRSLLVTSTAPSEGKSTASINLAVAFARAGKRVLLVDADLRRPRLHKAFGIREGVGITNLLIGKGSLDEACRETEIPGLFVLPCGVIPPNPVELLGSGSIGSLHEEMTKRFDLVVFDSPPAGVVSDASVLATVVDRVAFVVRTLHTNRVHARHALSRLREVGARIVGVILNHTDQRAGTYEGYGGYSSRYRYGEGADRSRALAETR